MRRWRWRTRWWLRWNIALAKPREVCNRRKLPLAVVGCACRELDLRVDVVDREYWKSGGSQVVGHLSKRTSSSARCVEHLQGWRRKFAHLAEKVCCISNSSTYPMFSPLVLLKPELLRGLSSTNFVARKEGDRISTRATRSDARGRAVGPSLRPEPMDRRRRVAIHTRSLTTLEGKDAAKRDALAAVHRGGACLARPPRDQVDQPEKEQRETSRRRHGGRARPRGTRAVARTQIAADGSHWTARLPEKKERRKRKREKRCPTDVDGTFRPCYGSNRVASLSGEQSRGFSKHRKHSLCLGFVETQPNTVPNR